MSVSRTGPDPAPMRPGEGPPRRDALLDEPRGDVQHYLSAVRRNSVVVAVTVVVITGTVVGISLALPKSYTARATIVVDVERGLLASPDAASQQRRLATLDEQLTSTRVLRQAAAELRGVTHEDLESQVESSVDREVNLVDVVASDQSPRFAASIANTVARVFLAQQRSLEGERLRGAIRALRAETGGDLPDARRRIGELRLELAAAGSELQIGQEAEPPEDPASPRPLQNGIAAFFASLLLGVLVALGRDQLRSTVATPRELSRLTGLPVLAGVPPVRRRFARHRRVVTAIEYEAYQMLAAHMERARPPGELHTILITSALHGEGKTTVTARLGKALAAAGHNTLIVSLDLRWPVLHELVNLRLEGGILDVLKQARNHGTADSSTIEQFLRKVPVAYGDPSDAGELYVLTAGGKCANPAPLLAGESLHVLFAQIRRGAHQYVLVDTPPALGIADVQWLAQEADAALWVSQLDRLTIDAIADAQELLARLPIDVLGHVVIGARAVASPYYVGDRRR